MGLPEIFVSLKRIMVFIICLVLLKMPFHISAQSFGNRQDLGEIEFNDIEEASGLAASRKNNGVLWTHNDSGDDNRLFAINTAGAHLGVYTIDGVSNRDWEDMAVGPGPLAGEQYLYIGDVGDNDADYDLKYIYRVLEPVVSASQPPVYINLTNVETITFEYPDGKRDAETIMVDPVTRDIYVVSKRETNVLVYRLPYPQSTTATITAEHVATLSLTEGQSPPSGYTVGGDISRSGREILLKTYTSVFYWAVPAGGNLWDAFNTAPLKLPYVLEPQGEAICWAPDALGYYTVSEETFGIPAHLFFYPRTDNPLAIQTDDCVNCGSVDYFLAQNYPNPFNPLTTIRYRMVRPGAVYLAVYDCMGQLVKRLVDARQAAGSYAVEWDGQTAEGLPAASGTYFFSLTAPDGQRLTRAMILVR